MCISVVEGSTDAHLQQQRDDVIPSSSSSSLCLHTVVMVTVPLCVVVLLTVVAVITLYALGARRRRHRMTSSPASAAAFPLPVSAGCRCVGVMVGCRPDSQCKSVQQLSDHQQQQKLVDAGVTSYDPQHPGIVTPTPPSNHSESTLLLVARDAWTS